MKNEMHHEGDDDPRQIFRIITLPVTALDGIGLNLSVKLKPSAIAIYNYLRHRGGWGKDHHGLTIGTIARAINYYEPWTRLVCQELVAAGIAEIEDETCKLVLTHVMVERSTTIDPDIAEYIARLCEGQETSFRDAVNYLLAEAIAGDMRNVLGMQMPRGIGVSTQPCQACGSFREEIVWGDGTPSIRACHVCEGRLPKSVKPQFRGNIGMRHSSQPPVVPVFE